MEKQKVICLMPVKNEVDLLPITLGILSRYCDTIIIADQMSDDGSRDVYKNFPKVQMIDNIREGHSNQVRWDLLKAAREHEGNNLLLSLDADEYIPPALFERFIQDHDFVIGESFRFPWIQLWKSIRWYNNTGAWYKNYQRAAWVDDRTTIYGDTIVINDHIARVPAGFLTNCKKVDDIPIIHLQWVSWNKTQLKQAWYRCTELIASPKNHIAINAAYSISLDRPHIALTPVPQEWTKGLDGLEVVEHFSPTWHLREIYSFFDKHGIEFFEPLQIWHIPELEHEFIKRTGRKPVSVHESPIVQYMRDAKRFLIKLIRS
jgi:hypothetical protein